MLCICSFYANLTVHMIQSHAEFLLFIVLVAVFFSGKQKRQARFRQLIPDLKGVLDFHVDEHVIQCAFNSFHRNFSARTKSIESTCGQTIKTAIAINVMIYIYIYTISIRPVLSIQRIMQNYSNEFGRFTSSHHIRPIFILLLSYTLINGIDVGQYYDAIDSRCSRLYIAKSTMSIWQTRKHNCFVFK